ncbi:MAG: helix-turn-helix domain-containing protein, partial [Aestuariivirgaceae bacterium]
MDQLKHSHPQEQFTFYRQKPEGDIDPAGEAGWYLQREREGRGMSLDEAGEACGIHPHHLEGIEHGDLTRLPPRTEALQMVGLYAQFLNFDPQPLVLHYAHFLPQPMPMAKRGKPRRPHPLTSAKIIKFPGIDKLKSAASGAGGVVA